MRCTSSDATIIQIEIEQQLLRDDLIPFSTQFSIDDSSVSVLFSSSISNQNNRSDNEAIFESNEEQAQALLGQDLDGNHCSSTSDHNITKKKGGRRSNKTITSLDITAAKK